jgi:hypothetical protein
VNPRGAPLRAWVVGPITSAAGSGAVAELAPIALRMLAGTDVSAVEIRAIHTGVL